MQDAEQLNSSILEEWLELGTNYLPAPPLLRSYVYIRTEYSLHG